MSHIKDPWFVMIESGFSLPSFFFFLRKMWLCEDTKENMQAFWIKDIRSVNIIYVISYSQVRNVINVYIIFLGIFSVLIFKIMII